jgi:hypothetical protein
MPRRQTDSALVVDDTYGFDPSVGGHTLDRRSRFLSPVEQHIFPQTAPESLSG